MRAMSADFQPGDLVIHPLGGGFGFVLGRISDSQATADHHEIIGAYRTRELAEAAAEELRATGERVWFYDANGLFTRV